jgi:hypothetical protein
MLEIRHPFTTSKLRSLGRAFDCDVLAAREVGQQIRNASPPPSGTPSPGSIRYHSRRNLELAGRNVWELENDETAFCRRNSGDSQRA